MPSVRWVKHAKLNLFALAEAAPASALVRAVALAGEPQAAGTPVEEARTLLRAAAEIEQQLMVEYLYALYSLAPTAPPNWRTILRTVAREEMGHLLTVQNLLLLLRADPHLARMGGVPAADQPFPLRLEPVSTGALAKYVSAESPDPMSLPPDVRALAQPAYEEAAANGVSVNRVGVLYAKISWLFQASDSASGPWAIPTGLFTPDRHLAEGDFDAASIHRQADPEDWRAGTSPAEGLFAVRSPDRATALGALHAVAEQGEGLTPLDPNATSHFERFLTLYGEARALVANGQPLPTLPVPVNPTYGEAVLPDAEREAARIEEAVSQAWAELSDVHYTILLGVIAVSLGIEDTAEGTALRTDLAEHAISGQMKGAVAALGRVLIQRPRKTGTPAQTLAAALPFSAPAPPISGTTPAWIEWLLEKMGRSDALIAQLGAGNPLSPPLTQIAATNANLRALLIRVPVA